MDRQGSGQAGSRTLRIHRTFACAREEVFQAWTDRDALAHWFAGDDAEALSATVDLQVGGNYRLTVRKGLDVEAIEGVYLEVEPPERLVFTLRGDRQPVGDRTDSVVTAEFSDIDAATKVVITHTGIESEANFAFHLRSWTAVLGRLEGMLQPQEWRR
jgi:uncharacterized protein YndB with AHSA1/START domain